MKKKILTIAIVILGIVVIIYGFLVFQALGQMSSYEPEGICGQAITKARHDLTGITSEFNSTCIPDGWSVVG